MPTAKDTAAELDRFKSRQASKQQKKAKRARLRATH